MYSRKKVFEGIRNVMLRVLSQEQVDSIDALLDALDKYEIEPKYAAYMLATAYGESQFRPVRETFAKSDGQAARNLERAYPDKRNKYWLIDTETGKRYFGRGFVQLTWKRNYQVMGDKIGVNLVEVPNAALRPKYAAEILVLGMKEGLFTGKSVYKYSSYRQMRRVVNGMDAAGKFAGWATRLLPYVEQAHGQGTPVEKTTTPPEPDNPVPTEPTEPEARHAVEVIIRYSDGSEQVVREMDPQPVETEASSQPVVSQATAQSGRKPMFASKTAWGILIAMAASVGPTLARGLGYEELASTLETQDVNQLVALAGSIFALYGRSAAKKKATLPKVTWR